MLTLLLMLLDMKQLALVLTLVLAMLLGMLLGEVFQLLDHDHHQLDHAYYSQNLAFNLYMDMLLIGKPCEGISGYLIITEITGYIYEYGTGTVTAASYAR